MYAGCEGIQCHIPTALDNNGHVSDYHVSELEINFLTTRYYYDGQMLMEDGWTRPVSSVTTKDVTKYGLGARGIDVIIATTGITSSNEGTTSTAFPLYDGHGNMVNTLSRGTGGSFTLGNSSFRYYDAWGSLDSGPGAGNEPRQRYCANLGHLQDDESGLIYMRARYYEPGTGRFVSEDPAMDGVNWYSYCGSEPILGFDYSGKYDQEQETFYALGAFGLCNLACLIALTSKKASWLNGFMIAACVGMATWILGGVQNRIGDIPDQSFGVVNLALDAAAAVLGLGESFVRCIQVTAVGIKSSRLFEWSTAAAIVTGTYAFLVMSFIAFTYKQDVEK